MPIYEYRCEKCEARFETLVFSSTEEVRCDTCGSEKVTRLMSMFVGKSGDKFVSSSSGDNCSGCTGKNCSSCG